MSLKADSRCVSSGGSPQSMLEDVLIELGYLGKRPAFVHRFGTFTQREHMAQGHFEKLDDEEAKELLEYAKGALAEAVYDARGLFLDYGDSLRVIYVSTALCEREAIMQLLGGGAADADGQKATAAQKAAGLPGIRRRRIR